MTSRRAFLRALAAVPLAATLPLGEIASPGTAWRPYRATILRGRPRPNAVIVYRVSTYSSLEAIRGPGKLRFTPD